MKKKNKFTITLVIVVAVTSLAFGSSSNLNFTKELFDFGFGTSNQNTSNIPDYVLYDKLFRMIVSFKNRAETQEMSAEKLIAIENYFKDRAKLNDEENQILQNIALGYIQEITPIDSQAKTIIAQARQSYAGGVVPRNQPLPAELVNLQEQRNTLVLKYRDRLKESYDSDGFDKLNGFIEDEFASQFESIPLSKVNFDQIQ